MPDSRTRRALAVSACLWVLVAAAACSTASAPAASTRSESLRSGATSDGPRHRVAGWRADLDRLVTAREEIHPDPWHGIPRDEYVAAVEEVADKVPDLSDDEMLVEVTRLAAMPTWAGRDGHGGIYPWGEGTYGVHMYPLRLYWFSDGLYVVDALPPYGGLVGSRVDAVNGHRTEQVLDAVEPLVPRDNEQQVRTHGPRLLLAAEVLHGLGLVDDPVAPTVFAVTPRGGETHQEGRRSVEVRPVPVQRYESWAGGHHAHSPPSRPGTAWLRRYSDPIWWELDPASGTAFVQYNLVVPGTSAVADEVGAAIDAGRVRRLVLDVRHNSGGDNTTYGPMVQLVEEAAGALPGRTFVVIGRATFSAAGNFVTAVERSADAVLVGEDSGGSPNQFGDSRTVPLTHSGLVLRVAPEYVEKSDPDDRRVTISPDVPAPLSSQDHFTDRDPAMAVILSLAR